MAKKNDITDIVERIEAFEAKLEVKLESIGAFLSGPDYEGDYEVTVNGEIHSINGENIDSDLNLVIGVYGKDNKLLVTSSVRIHSDNFFVFEMFSKDCYAPSKPTRIRIYPQLA